MRNDLRSAWRNLRHAPGVSAIIVLTLALAIGANTAVFSIVNRLLFDPLPYPAAGRLVGVTFAVDDDEEEPLGRAWWPYPKYAAFAKYAVADSAPGIEATAAYGTRQLSVLVGDQPHRAEAEFVTAGYFPLLGVTQAHGRLFHAEEDSTPGEAPVVVLSDRFWRSHFGGETAALGQPLTIRGRAYEVVGVLPPSFRGQTGTTELWLTTMAAEHAAGPGSVTAGTSWWLQVIARLRADVPREQAEAALPAVARQVDAEFMARMGPGEERYRLVPLHAMRISPDVRQAFVLLLGAVAVVLLIATANAASLLLGRAVARQREFAVRLAIGAGRGALIRQLTIESLLLSLSAGALGLAVAWGALEVLTTTRPANPSGFWAQYMRTFEFFDVSLDLRALGVTLAAAIGSGLLFGLAPAWRATRTDIHDTLKHGSGASAAGFGGVNRMGARGALVVVEVALSIVLLAAAGLMARSFGQAAAADLGFVPDGVLTMGVAPAGRKPVAFYHELVSRLEALPGIQTAALSAGTPLGPQGWEGPVVIEGRGADEPDIRGILNVVTPGYFETYRLRLVGGRTFSDQDLTGPPVAIVSRALAERAWPGQDPIGRRVRYSLVSKEWLEVVGVIDHATYTTLEAPPPAMLYAPLWRAADPAAVPRVAPTAISIRTAAGADVTARAVRAEVRGLDPSAPVFGVATLTDRAARVTARYRYSTLMMSGMALLALLLAAIGTYGVLAYAVSSRTREIGIRMALGASPGHVLRMVLVGGFSLALAGLALGLLGAFATTRLLGALLFGVTPADPFTFAAISVLMLGVAGLASTIPAVRAMRVDPADTMRTA